MHVNVESVTNPDPQIQKRLILAIDLAYHAGQKTLEWFSNPLLEVRHKSDRSPVTVADEMAESFVRQALLSAFPSDGFLGEESGSVEGTSGFDWIVDPIDGTKSFIRGVPLYSTLVGCRHNDCGVIGVIAIAALNEMVYASFGAGAWHVVGSSTPIKACVSSRRVLSESLFCTTDPVSFGKTSRRGVRDALESACLLSRSWGDGYGYLLVATGRAEVMADPLMNRWDAAAVEVVVREAGGTFTDWKGIESIDSGEGLATNGLVLEETLLLTRG